MAVLKTETAWDVAPDSTSTFDIYNAEDQWIMGNATDAIKKYDGSGISTLDGNAPKGSILAVYKDRLMVAGDTSFPHRIWFSHLHNAEGWSRDTDWLDVRPEDGGEINGFGISNDELIISKNNGRLYGWRIYEDGTPQNSRLRIIEDDKGMINAKSGTTLEDVFYYLDRNQISRLPQPLKGGLSYVVDEVVKGVNSFENASAGSNDGKAYIALGDIDIEIGDKVSLSNAVLVYDTPSSSFYLLDNISARTFSRFIDSTNNEHVYFGDANGKVFKMETGTTADNDPIHMRIRTKPYFRELGKQITVRKVGIYMDDPDGTIVTYRTSLTESFERQMGSVTEEPVQWFEVDAQGGLFQMEINHSGSNARPTLVKISIVYDIGGNKDD